MLLSAALTAFLFDASVREDELECEQAAAHWLDCCGDSRPWVVSCTFHESYCGADVFPELSAEQSRCIQDMSCAEIQRNELCAVLGRRSKDGGPPDGGPDTPDGPREVPGCP
ncbi:MAG: hypothetical protein HY744_32070 [Deltaproteobacteria bacterium]|nr:hypothetical protein [Deltaproteobacteria bacterium]